ncbi:MAG: amidophosphoribosyltransferase [Pseudomonadota bacterium]|jgi:amidophosphoribosyltransferase
MCGVVGVIGSQSASRDVYAGLLALQHRGQDAAGILSFDFNHKKFHLVRGAGLVSQAFDQPAMGGLGGMAAIGHTRYSTVGVAEERDIQPSILPQPYGIGMAHNGNLSNYTELAERIRVSQNRYLQTGNDLEVLQCLLAEGLSSKAAREILPGRFDFEAFCRAVDFVFDTARGGYAVVGIIAGQGMYAFRDPSGIRPLVLGRRDEDGSVSIASETAAFNIMGHRLVRDIEPGEIVFVEESGAVHSRKVAGTALQRKAPCMFEWVYFASAESVIEGRGVYGARLDLGRALARLVKSRAAGPFDMVVPVPDTSRTAAISLAESLGIPYRDVLIKNRYVFRSFILNTQQDREQALRIKLAPVASEIAGKSVLLVDDSVVRGTTARRLVSLVRSAGARQVFLASTCPPVRHPCFYGIDFPDARGLVAHERSEDEVAREIGVDGIFYLDVDSLRASIGLPSLCTACLDGNYPVPCQSVSIEGVARS